MKPIQLKQTLGIISLAALANIGHGHDVIGGHPEDPPSEIQIMEKEGYRHFIGNGIPNHDRGDFPRRGNPHKVTPQNYHFKVPLHPEAGEQVTPMVRMPFGIALNGVLFDPGTAEYWQRNPQSGWNFDALAGSLNLGLDENNAHVQPNGAYHYHGLPKGLGDWLGHEEMTLLGYAADGFPIYNNICQNGDEVRSSYQIKEGHRPSGPRGEYDGRFVEDWVFVEGLGDLDECNGHFSATPDGDEMIYHYHLTTDFPFIPRKFRGTPDSTFTELRGQRANQGGNRGQNQRRARRAGRGQEDRRGPPTSSDLE